MGTRVKINVLPAMDVTDIKRFWDKVNKSDNCWEWSAALDSRGYGRFGVHDISYGKHRLYGAHRISYYLAYNNDPGKFFICHSCDNPKCVRPDHLWLGTCKDNALDA